MKVSIITINYNGKMGLAKTVNSVLAQTHTDIEYILIDGGSSDGSKEYIRTNSGNFSYWVSEADNGVYNAMNKGIAQASGEYLLFLNSGDCLANNRVLQKFVGTKPTADIVYGNAYLQETETKGQMKRMPAKLNVSLLLNFTITHQAIFHKRGLFADHKRYNEDYTIIADWVFYTNALIFGKASYCHINLTICNYDWNGISRSQENIKRIREEKEHYLGSAFDESFIKLLADYNALLKFNNGLIETKFIKLLSWVKRKLYMANGNKDACL